MNRKLRQEDRRAVDLLLDRTPAAARGNGQVVYAGNVGGRVESVEKVLHLLDAMDATEPPADLVAKTLERIELASANPEGRSDLHRFLGDTSGPVA